MYLLDADEGPLLHVIQTVNEIVDGTLEIETDRHTLGVMKPAYVLGWKERGGGGENDTVPPLGYHLGSTMALRSWLFDRIAVFERGEISTFTPIIDGLERTALQQTVLALRVVIHERIHAAQAKHGYGGAGGVNRVLLEGLTQLETDMILPTVLDALGWVARDPRIPELERLPIYPAETSAMAALLIWATETNREDPAALLLKAARVARTSKVRDVFLHARAGDDISYQLVVDGTNRINRGFEPLGDITLPKRLPSGENSEPPEVRKAFGTAVAKRVMASLDELVAQHRSNMAARQAVIDRGGLPCEAPPATPWSLPRPTQRQTSQGDLSGR